MDDLVRVSIFLEGKGNYEVWASNLRKDYPFTAWTHIVFPDDWEDGVLLRWLDRNKGRGGPEWERWTLDENAVSLAPEYVVQVRS